MSENQTVEPQSTQPSTKRKIANTASQVLVGLVVTVVASAVTEQLNKKVSNFIMPDTSDN